RALSQANVPLRYNVRFRRQAGGWLALEATLTNLLAVAQLRALVITMHALPADQPAALFLDEDKFAALFELAPDAIFLADLETGLIADANPAAVALMGNPREQLIGTHFTALHPPDQLALAQSLFSRPLPAGESISAWAEIEVLAAGGVRKAVEIRGRIITLNKRNYVLGSFRDVTARKQMEVALRESEARNRAILEAIPDLMFRLNRQGDIIDFRANDPQDLVLPPEQVIGSNIYSNMPPEVATLILDHIALTLDTDLPQIIEYNLPVRSGLHDFEARLMASGEDEVVAIVRNITHRKRAEAALSDSEARFRTVWEVVSDAMVLSDPDGIVLAANPAYAELYGYPLDQIIGHSFAIIFPPEDRAWAVEQYQTVFASPEVPIAFESQVQRANGEQRMVESRMNFIVQNGQRVAMLSTIRDITERKKAEDQLRQLSQAVEQSPTSIIITDVDGNIEYVNPAFTANTGYSFAEVKGRNPNILKSELTPPHIYVELWNTVLAGETYRCEFHNRKKNG
ncbi:MAG: PAS domain S-box protein, partial [Anaerolineae bacterium]|nr:PAS domain S-box protein [Anaerolineae bacterium]